MSEKLCWQWYYFKENVTSAFVSLRKDNDFSDVTLTCKDGQQFEAHKVILASSSPFFQNILKRSKHAHPMIYMRGMKSEELLPILDFLYSGEAYVYQESLDSFLSIAEELQLNGLMGKANDDEVEQMDASKPRENPVLKNESQIPMFSQFWGNYDANIDDADIDNKIAVKESVGSVAQKSNFSEYLKKLDNKTNSLMVRTSNKNVRGRLIYKCTLCKKEAELTNIKNHIEANHLEGITVPCNQCEKTFRSTDSLQRHHRVICKQNPLKLD